ncbi:hypothetical protein SAMN05421805_11380 [Saccharopolyspora antimicrobica]|uniref:Uncharacterized protein n=1 Tax=Saccharopolyspora antimicrobica TaxID=455193 RepID=A0A1I5GP25_9PSEU|nr:hypothetical protein [Saccharopolyspora antimicrobica]RKT87455.1 hypothetical protein ATL45_5873 [Saccharopolyspora antimicrobica]SFO37281.1 hypothetical protein SAMN05421805_11380 [Saccharopolyspora antimicrobica]
MCRRDGAAWGIVGAGLTWTDPAARPPKPEKTAKDTRAVNSVNEALQLYPELAILVGIQTLWTFWILTDPLGRPEWLVGVVSWPEHSDALWIADRQHALAARLLVATPSGGIVWQSSGTLAATIDALSNLPAPGTPGAPCEVLKPGPFWPPARLC